MTPDNSVIRPAPEGTSATVRSPEVKHHFAREVKIDRGVIDEIHIARQLARRGWVPLQ